MIAQVQERVTPVGFRTETGLCLQFIQQHLDRPVWDVSIASPIARFLGKIELGGPGWKITNVRRQPHAGLISYLSYHEAAIALLELCRKPANLPTKEVLHEVCLVNRRKQTGGKVLIVVSTPSDAFSEVWREIEKQISVRGLKGYRFEGEFKLLSDPF